MFTMDAVNTLNMVIPMRIHTTAKRRPKTVEGVRSPYLVVKIEFT